MMKSMFFAPLAAPLLLAGCNFGDEKVDARLKERVGQEAEQTQVKEREARENLVHEMEADLRERHRVYQGLRGQFAGVIEIDRDQYSVAAEFVPVVIPFDSATRVRTPDEVSADLQNLAVDTRVVIRDQSTNALLANCHGPNVKLDLSHGTMSWLSDSSTCSNLFGLFMSPEVAIPDHRSVSEVKEASKILAEQIRAGNEPVVKSIVLRMRPSNSSEDFVFVLKKVEL